MKKITLYAFICFINLATNPLAAMDECKENTNQYSHLGPVDSDANNIIKKVVEEAVGNGQGQITLDVQEFKDYSDLLRFCESSYWH